MCATTDFDPQAGKISSMPGSVMMAISCLGVFSLTCVCLARVDNVITSDADVVSYLMKFAFAGCLVIIGVITRRVIIHWLAYVGCFIIAGLWGRVWLVGSVFALLGATGGPEEGQFQTWQALALLALNIPFATIVVAALALSTPSASTWFRHRQRLVRRT